MGGFVPLAWSLSAGATTRHTSTHASWNRRIVVPEAWEGSQRSTTDPAGRRRGSKLETICINRCSVAFSLVLDLDKFSALDLSDSNLRLALHFMLPMLLKLPLHNL